MTDTIAAISTPPGPGAIGILRLSGPEAAAVAEKCFKPLGRKGLREHAPRELVYGDLLDSGGEAIDRVLCTYSLGPASYTGEDTAEFQCHGSPMVLALGLEALFAAGARQARAGEFTRRLEICWTPRAGRGPAMRRASWPGHCPKRSERSTPRWWT